VQCRDHRLICSPSDVTAYLALSSLPLQVARGELGEPPFDNEQDELVFR
jgi:hypothetical protein